MTEDIDLKVQQAQALIATEIQKFALDSSNQPEILGTMVELSARLAGPVKMALAGEFSSGKTTLARMLLGQDFVTTKASASAMPTVRFRYGVHEKFTLITGDEQRDIAGLDDLTDADMRAADALVITIDLPFLKRVELFDTPGTSDPTRTIDQIVDIANEVDFIMWCTNATQAWRQSERAMWEELPARSHVNSLLIVTHVDLPKVKASLPRLMKRMHKEASDMFRQILPVDLLSAIKSRFDASLVNDPINWMESGGEACIAAISEIVDQVKLDQIAEVEALFGKVEVPIASTPVKSAIPPAKFFDLWADNLSTIDATLPDAYLEFLQDFKEGRLGAWSEENSAKIEIQERLHEAVAFLNGNIGADLAKDVVVQLDWEFRSIIGAAAA